MSAESNELLWETNSSEQLSRTITCESSSSATVPSAITSTHSSPPLFSHEESLALDDWDATQVVFGPPEPLPDEVIALMEARMAAPQGGLDPSYASHSCESAARNAKRARIYSYVWVDRKTPEPPVGISLYDTFKERTPTASLYILKKRSGLSI